MEYQGERFVRKSELHATVMGARERHDGTALAGAARGLELKVFPLGRYRLVRKGERRALIELARVEGQEEFCARLEDALGLPRGAAPRMPGHVTLFTESGGKGIALYLKEELETLSIPAALKLDASPWRLDGDGAILCGA